MKIVIAVALLALGAAAYLWLPFHLYVRCAAAWCATMSAVGFVAAVSGAGTIARLAWDAGGFLGIPLASFFRPVLVPKQVPWAIGFALVVVLLFYLLGLISRLWGWGALIDPAGQPVQPQRPVPVQGKFEPWEGRHQLLPEQGQYVFPKVGDRAGK